MRTWLCRIAIVGTAVASMFMVAAPAHAIFPGQDRVAFVRYDSNDATIHTIDIDGSNLKTPVKALGAMLPRFMSAALSPDGTKILYSRVVNDTNVDLYVKTIGGSIDRITHTGGIWEYSASWSPNGRRIAFSETDNTSYGRLAVSRADGTNYVPVFTSPIDFVWYPSWSPDGTRIAFSSSDGTDREIYLAPPLAGVKVAPITNNAVDDLAGDWSANGGRIALVREPAAAPRPAFGTRAGIRWHAPRGIAPLGDVFTIRTDGSHPFQVTDDTKTFGRVIYATKDSFLVSRLAHVSIDLYSVSTGGGGYTRLTRTAETYNVVDLAKFVLGIA
jgi:Tol biopolymer transport system component